MKYTLATLAVAAALTACGDDGPHNLSVDEARRAQTYAEAFFDMVIFMVKVTLASIPAAAILVIIGIGIAAILAVLKAAVGG